MSNEFKVGDIVLLKSGGPKMTVDKVRDTIGSDEFVNCVWFAGAKREHAVFKPDTLTLVPKESPSKK